MNFSRPIILASKSPRRRSLLKAIVPSFKTQTKEVLEDYPNTLKPTAVASFLAQKKASAFPPQRDGSILVTADTTVIHENKILGKPRDESEAREMLSALSGTVHDVNTGICLTSHDKQVTFDEVTKVYFQTLTDRVICDYISTFRPFDKAGAYGIQECIKPGTNLLSDAEDQYLRENSLTNFYKEVTAHLSPNPPVFYIDRIEGYYFNVMGLPIVRLYQELVKF